MSPSLRHPDATTETPGDVAVANGPKAAPVTSASDAEAVGDGVRETVAVGGGLGVAVTVAVAVIVAGAAAGFLESAPVSLPQPATSRAHAATRKLQTRVWRRETACQVDRLEESSNVSPSMIRDASRR